MPKDKKEKYYKSLYLAAAGLFLAAAVHAASVETLLDFKYFSGQSFYKDTPSTLSGNAYLSVAPAIKFSDKLSLIPQYYGSYRGALEVNDLIGGAMTFQDAMTHLISAKAVYAPKPYLKIKPQISMRYEYLRETKDEAQWGTGLFDYNKINYGVEVQYDYAKKQSLSLGLDLFTIRFPNWEALETAEASAGLGRELSGKNALDTNNSMISMKLKNAFVIGGSINADGELNAGLMARAYTDSRVMTSNGNFSSEYRAERYMYGSYSLSVPARLTKTLGLICVLDAQYTVNDSNQNHLDTLGGRVNYIPDFYDYTNYGGGPAINFVIIPKNTIIEFGYNIFSKRYATRTIQNETGLYDDSTLLFLNDTAYKFGITQKINKNFKFKVNGNYVISSSNTKYEKVYAYNYNSSNIMLGFIYEY